MGIDRNLFVDEVPADCVCSICQEVLEDPKETLTCQHAFCHVCITSWLHDHHSCPSCRCPLSINDLVSLHRIWRDKLNHLRVRCQNYHIGCDAVVELDRLDYHYDNCSYVRVTCPHSPCSEIVVRSLLHGHIESCDYRKITCLNCQLNIPALSLKDHECIPALREDMQRKVEILRREWSDCIRLMHREHRKLEEKLHDQSNQIAELRNAITILTSHRKPTTLPHLPAISVTGNAIRMGSHTHTGTVTTNSRTTHTSRRDTARGTTTNNLSLPRLAPLHTHMSLSRNSGQYSGKSWHYLYGTLSRLLMMILRHKLYCVCVCVRRSCSYYKVLKQHSMAK